MIVLQVVEEEDGQLVLPLSDVLRVGIQVLVSALLICLNGQKLGPVALVCFIEFLQVFLVAHDLVLL